MKYTFLSWLLIVSSIYIIGSDNNSDPKSGENNAANSAELRHKKSLADLFANTPEKFNVEEQRALIALMGEVKGEWAFQKIKKPNP